MRRPGAALIGVMVAIGLPGCSEGQVASGAEAESFPEGGREQAKMVSRSQMALNCYARVERMTGARVLETLRIERDRAATRFYLKVQGATAAWQCVMDDGGVIDGVMYTGDQDALQPPADLQ